MGVEYTLLFRRLADGNQSIVHKVILNWLIKTDGVTVTDRLDRRYYIDKAKERLKDFGVTV